MHQSVCAPTMKLGGVHHVEATLMSPHHTSKPSTIEEIRVKGSEIHLHDSLYCATIPHLLVLCVEVAHDATIICGSALVYLACTKMTPL